MLRDRMADFLFGKDMNRKHDKCPIHIKTSKMFPLSLNFQQISIQTVQHISPCVINRFQFTGETCAIHS